MNGRAYVDGVLRRFGRWLAFALAATLALTLAGCRDIRVRTYAQGYSFVPADGPQVAVVRSVKEMASLGIDLKGIDYRHVFAVVLLMGPHPYEGYRQIIASIRASDARVRIVAFEEPPAKRGIPREDRTYTVWLIPNLVYTPGAQIQVVTPDGALLTATTLP